MFLFGISNKKNNTIESIPTTISSKLSIAIENRSKTLGTGDLRIAVKVPINEEINEWIALNLVDFFSEISLLWGLVIDGSDENDILNIEIGNGFPSGVEYRWSIDKTKVPIRCNGPTYIEYTLNWIEKELNNSELFPKTSEKSFPKTYIQQVKQLYTKLYRVFAIIYSHHFNTLERMGAVAHLNTCFKHFMFFCFEFELLKNEEMECINEIITELRLKFKEPLKKDESPK